MITIKDIAKKCNVSPSTVSLVLSNNPAISSKTRKKVLKAMDDMGYYPNFSARNLVRKYTNTIALMVPQISHITLNPFFSDAIMGIYKVLSEENFKILFEVASEKFLNEKIYERLFRERIIDGMIYIGSTLMDNYLEFFESYDFPFILAGSYFDKLKVSYVIGDNLKGGYLATKHLIDLGRKRIALITGNMNVVSARDRFKGYKKALKEGKISFREKLISYANFDEKTGYYAMKTLIREKPDAVFCGNDLMAYGAINAIRDSGLQIPDDIAVCGMDNAKSAIDRKDSFLTTVDYNIQEMGIMAAKELVDWIREKKLEKQIREVLPVSLVVKESTLLKNDLVRLIKDQ